MAIPAPIHSHLEYVHGFRVQDASPVGGGCIHHAHRLETNRGLYFLKYNHKDQAHNFEVESKGLELLGGTGIVSVPKVYEAGVVDKQAYLLLEFVPSGRRNSGFWEKLGENLAQLHQQTQAQFGLAYDNYIGALPQSNQLKSNWTEFFIEERLQPMIRMARDRGRLPGDLGHAFQQLFPKLGSIFPEEPSALIHGDLWGGNLMTGSDGLPVLIDPAVYYGHREIELAFMTLFDSQPTTFYQAYESVWPLEVGFQDRIDLYNLYPLMVHVNLFGGGYVHSVQQILRRFT